MRRAGPGAVAVVAAACAIVVAGCGGDEGGTATIQYLGPLDPGGTNVAAAKECSDQSNGRYRVTMSPVANSADATPATVAANPDDAAQSAFRGIATAYGFYGTAVGQATGNNPDWSIAAAGKPPGGQDDGKPDTGKPEKGTK